MVKLLLYCYKRKPYLYQSVAKPMHTKDINDPFNYKWRLVNHKTQNSLNGKVVAECDFEVEEIYSVQYSPYIPDEFVYRTQLLQPVELENESDLTQEQLFDYLTDDGKAIHIKNLCICPRELSSYTCVKGPRNMQYVYTCYDKNKYILMSVGPEELCKILNGEKTIIIRKKVLKGMLDND